MPSHLHPPPQKFPAIIFYPPPRKKTFHTYVIGKKLPYWEKKLTTTLQSPYTSPYNTILFFAREQLRKKAEEDLKENINVIRRNLPAKKDGIAGYLSQTTQEIADQIARNLVDRALELDRKRLVKKIVKLK